VSDQEVDLDELGFELPLAAGEGTTQDVLTALLSGVDDDEYARDRERLADVDVRALDVEYAHLVDLRAKRDAVKGKLKDVNALVEAATARVMAAMEVQGTRQFSGELGGAVLGKKFQTKVVEPAAFAQWVIETHPEILTIHANTRNKIVREEFEDRGIGPGHAEFPPGLEAKEVVTLRVLKPKGAPKKETE
jgi:hypothetical protein